MKKEIIQSILVLSTACISSCTTLNTISESISEEYYSGFNYDIKRCASYENEKQKTYCSKQKEASLAEYSSYNYDKCWSLSSGAASAKTEDCLFVIEEIRKQKTNSYLKIAEDKKNENQKNIQLEIERYETLLGMNSAGQPNWIKPSCEIVDSTNSDTAIYPGKINPKDFSREYYFWTDDDFNSFQEAIVECKDKKGNYSSKDYIKEETVKAIQDAKSEFKEGKLSFIKNKYEVSEFDKKIVKLKSVGNITKANYESMKSSLIELNANELARNYSSDLSRLNGLVFEFEKKIEAQSLNEAIAKEKSEAAVLRTANRIKFPIEAKRCDEIREKTKLIYQKILKMKEQYSASISDIMRAKLETEMQLEAYKIDKFQPELQQLNCPRFFDPNK